MKLLNFKTLNLLSNKKFSYKFHLQVIPIDFKISTKRADFFSYDFTYISETLNNDRKAMCARRARQLMKRHNWLTQSANNSCVFARLRTSPNAGNAQTIVKDHFCISYDYNLSRTRDTLNLNSTSPSSYRWFPFTRLFRVSLSFSREKTQLSSNSCNIYF